MTNPPAIRQVVEDDAEAYRELRLHLLQVSPDSYGSTYEESVVRPIEHTAERLRVQRDPDLGITLGAFMPELVGMVTLLRSDGAKSRHKATVYGMGVAEEYRGQGIGKALMAATIAHARTMPDLEQVLLTVTLPNPAALRLYQSLGFVTYGIDRKGLKLGDRYWDEEQMILEL